MSEHFVSGVSAKIVLYKYSSFPFYTVGLTLEQSLISRHLIVSFI